MKTFIPRLNISGRMAVHGIIGGIIGYAILHPFSMVIHSYFNSHSALFEAFLNSFLVDHIIMALYFTTLGGAIGIIHGYFTHNMIVLNLKLQSMAISDPLTDIYNRRFLMDFLTKEIERSKRYKEHLSLILIDIDFFKKYNDTFGHVKGDSLLRNISKLFAEQVRKADIVARYGGEEFAIVLPNTKLEMATDTAERIRKCVEDSFEFKREEDSHGRLTISIGVAEYNSSFCNIEGFVNSADVALYRAKDTGRNKVCSIRNSDYD